MTDLYIGIMSGTSLDGADAILIDWASRHTLAFASQPFDPDLRQSLLDLCASGPDELVRTGIAASRLARVYADVARQTLHQANIRPADVRAIGCHGQTVRHHPELGFTWQIQNAALLAELTGITVVADFRSRDVAAGGQGAPLAPAFHAGAFASTSHDRCILNVGGISNLTLLGRSGSVSGFDCGPGNVLLDAWIMAHRGTPLDLAGAWAATGSVLPDLLARLLADPYFDLPPPKSTGRERFNLAWLSSRMPDAHRPEDVQATLLELTACAIAAAINRQFPECDEVYVCGGGAQNRALLSRLAAVLPNCAVATTNALGIPAQQVEAAAFAWLAQLALMGTPVNLTQVTGAGHPAIAGAIYRA